MTAPTLYQRLPSVDVLINAPALAQLRQTHGHTLVRNLAREAIDLARQSIRTQQVLPSWAQSEAALIAHIQSQAQASAQLALRAVFNLTGTVLHTNLGRALQSESAIAAVTDVMRNAATLEYDLADASRGHRDAAISALLCDLTGAQAACVVNNNAAAVFLLLAVVARGKEVVVSRGELVEIGGAFRVPDVMREAGCQLVEVGTTNRTHLHDYADAMNEHTALLMKVHTSNYAITGFTHAVTEAELAALAHERGVAVATDLGSGALIDLSAYGLPREPIVGELVAAGLDLISFSGDKLLGGPQAGIIVGKKHWIDKIQSHPLKRALRCDKMTLAALEATLRLYQRPEKLAQQLPTLRLLSRTQEDIAATCARIAPLIKARLPEFIVTTCACQSQVGSGSLPVDRLPSHAIVISDAQQSGTKIEALAQRLRALPKPVIGRITEGALWLDLRCLEDEAGFVENLAV